VLKYFANTENKPANILVGLKVRKPMKVRIRAIDPNKKGACYIDRYMTIKDSQDFEIRLPQSPKKLLILIDSPDSSDRGQTENSIRLTKLEKIKLNQYLPCLADEKTKIFIKLAKEFTENAGILSPGRYTSDNKKFIIDYLPVIVEKGKELTTPARISNSTGRMEISARYFRSMSIPMRMAILLHEYSHFYMNEIQKDEIEADLNALTIYLSMGYPVIEAHKAFLETFEKHPTGTNKERYTYLKTFIDNWDSMKENICK
jgi:hypothetical protein